MRLPRHGIACRSTLIPFAAAALVASLLPATASAGELVRGVRGKLSAGDLASGQAAVEAYRTKTGVDPEYLDAVGWLARGAAIRFLEEEPPRGLSVVPVTRLYGPGADSKPATPAGEKALLEKTWRESYPGLEALGIVVDTDTMVRYGASATPTYALVDRKGIVRFYAPTRVAESELARRIEELLAEAP